MRLLQSSFVLSLLLAATVARASELKEPTEPDVLPTTPPERKAEQAEPPLVPAETPDIPPRPPEPPPPTPAPAPSLSSSAVEQKALAPAVKVPAVRVGVGPHIIARSFGWDSATSNPPFPDYSMPPQLAMAVGAEWYPGAHATQGGIANLGLYGDAVFGLGIATQGFNTQWGTRTQRIRAGARYRIPLGNVEFGLHAGFVMQSWDIDTTSIDGVARPRLPNLDLGAVRGGVDWRFNAGPFVLSAAVAGYGATGLGEIASDRYFPQAAGAGFDVSGAVVWPFADSVDLKLDVDYARTMLILNGNENAPVTGAADGLITAGAVLSCHI